MNILDRISSDTSIVFRKAASTRGGEYWGPCPWCGGDDRFSIHPEQDHYVCRGCRKAGDTIKWLRDYHQQSYFEACKTLGIQPNMQFKSLDAAKDKPGQNELIWKPREIEQPSLTWQSKAEAVLFSAYKMLLSPAGKSHRNWLNARGISNTTIKIARIGLTTRSLTFDMESWGLTPVQNQQGRNKQVWIPAGLIIPYFFNGKPVRLRIRQDNPVSSDRYIIVSGSSTAFFDYHVHNNTIPETFKPYVVTESELDGWLIQQEAGNLVDVYSIGNAQSRPDLQTHQKINNQPGLVNLDNDDAGRKEQTWWLKQYPHSKPWVSSFGKDPGEDFELGIDIQSWIQDGLNTLDMQSCSAGKSAGPEKFDKAAVITAARKKLEAQHAAIAEKLQSKTVDKPAASTPAAQSQQQPRSVKDCIHGQYCASHKNGDCLILKGPVSQIDECPKQQWYRYTDPAGTYTQIIFGMEYGKRRR